MKRSTAGSRAPREMRSGKFTVISAALFISSYTTPFVGVAVKPQDDYNKTAILSIAYFIESANNSVNSLNSLLRKDNYRNKITTLNNPVNNELGFSLRTEILAALKPILDKAKRTDKKKFKEVVENFLSSPEENGIGAVKKYVPVLGIFSTVLSLVGNLVITEKNITSEDLDQFVSKVQQYFSQYEKLNAINEHFGAELKKLVERSQEIKEELKEFLTDCVATMNKNVSRQSLKDSQVESLIRRYYDPQKLLGWFDSSSAVRDLLYPFDAPTSAKLITSGIKKLQKDFETLYGENYRQLKDLLATLQKTIPGLDEEQLAKTNREIDLLYAESRQADLINLNISQVEERMTTVCRVINASRRPIP